MKSWEEELLSIVLVNITMVVSDTWESKNIENLIFKIVKILRIQIF